MADECIFPEEILHKIFLRMPTKPLLQLKCLSKHWNSVISNSSFMKSRSRRMIIPPVLPLHAIDNSVQGNDMNHSMIKLHFPYAMLEDKDVTIVGSFNGIVFLVLKNKKVSRLHEMILYNPFTGAFKIVPDPPRYCHSNYVYGFGYGTTLDDLKIFRIMVHKSCGSRFYDTFNLKSGAWSSPSELIGDHHFLKYSGTFINGFLYLVAAKDRHWRPLILALDMHKMVFSEILIPSGCKWNCLGTFDGHLCMICTKTNDLELWILNDLDFGNIWSKKCSAKYPSISDNDKMSSILCVLDDGKLLLLMSPSNQLIVYDMFKEAYKEVNTLTSFSQVWDVQSIEYVESLISPDDMCSTLIEKGSRNNISWYL